MSKGSKVVPVRVEPKLLEKMTEELWIRNTKRKNGMYTMSEYIRLCITRQMKEDRRRRKKEEPITVEPMTFDDFDIATGEAR